jgi:predicted membrane channel-forming protein YqfA (hemolysin III family)
MDQVPPAVPPRPEPPDPANTPRLSSFVFWMAVGSLGLAVLALIAFVATPILWIAVAAIAMGGLHYLVWGWWFEKIYRSNPPADDNEVLPGPWKDPRNV